MKPIPHLHADLSGIRGVGAAKGVRAIDEITGVAEISDGDFRRPVLAKGLPHRNVEGVIRRQVRGTVAVEESGTVIEVAGYPGTADEIDVGADTKCVALVVVEEEEVFTGFEIGQSTGDASLPFDRLMRIRDMGGSVPENLGRPQRNLLATDPDAID